MQWSVARLIAALLRPHGQHASQLEPQLDLGWKLSATKSKSVAIDG